MAQVSSKLRRAKGRYFHWCPACEEMHALPDGWTFDGNLEQPTFSPSFKHHNPGFCCHYILTAGQLSFCGDCTHAMAGQSVPLPALPARYQDGPECIWSDGDEPSPLSAGKRQDAAETAGMGDRDG